MRIYIHIGELQIPSYGFFIVLGVLLANAVGFLVLRKEKLDLNDFFITEGYVFLGGFMGAKLLYLFISRDTIRWERISDLNYLNQLMKGGFVFYGGLIGALLLVPLCGKIHKIAISEYVQRFIFLIPFVHGFGRIGCFCAGCCYGKPYNGIGAVVYPEGSAALSGVKLFPVQLVEAGCLFCIAGLILFLQLRKNWKGTLELYLLLYAAARYILEYFRYDAARGKWFLLSTSQWISIGMAAAAMVLSCYKKKKAHL